MTSSPASRISPHIDHVTHGHRSGSSQVAVTIIGIAAQSFRDNYLKADGRMGGDPLGYAASALVADQAKHLASRQDRMEANRKEAEQRGERPDYALQTGIAVGMLEAISFLAATALMNSRTEMAPPALEFVERVLKEAGNALARDREYAARMAEQDRRDASRVAYTAGDFLAD